MAGAARPIRKDLKSEAAMTIHSLSLYSGTTESGLINEVQANEWNTTNVAYWNATSHYVEVSFDVDVNIWRSGSEGWKQHIAQLIIKKFNGSTYDDVTSLYSLPTTQINHFQWETFVQNLPAGRYRFEETGARLDSEWYIEDVNGSLIYSIKNDISEVKELGDMIPCKYVTVKNTVGVYSDLGMITALEIPATSTPTPNGMFYWKFAGYDFIGRKMFIADRNIQHNISWNTLNNAGVVNEVEVNPVDAITYLSKHDPNIADSSSIYLDTAVNWGPWKAFTGDHTTTYGWFVGGNSGWLSYEFENDILIDSYTIIRRGSGGDISETPKDWTFEGYNKVLNQWDVLHVVQNQPPVESGVSVTNKFNNYKKYKKYRLNITDNNGGSYTGVGALRMYEKTNHIFSTRLLTGGISAEDTDNEWDKIICESDLGGTIIPGDSGVWNWKTAMGSWCSDTISGSSSKRCSRGGTVAVTDFNNNSYSESGSVNVYRGFRPVLLVQSILNITNIILTDTLIDDSDIVITGDIISGDVTEMKYSILVNDADGYKSQLITTPIAVNNTISKDLFNIGENSLKIIAIENGIKRTLFEYIIYKSDRDTFTIVQELEYDNSPITEGGVKLISSEGSGVEGYGIGSGIINIPTEGKSSIKNILIDQSLNITKEMDIKEDMNAVTTTNSEKFYEKEIDLSKVAKLINLNINFK